MAKTLHIAGYDFIDGVPVKETWAPYQEVDVTNDKAIKLLSPVPSGQEWSPVMVYVKYVSTATPGNRQLCVEFLNGSANQCGMVLAGAVQAASLTKYYTFGLDLPDLTAFKATDYLTTPLPRVVMPEGWRLRVWDAAQVDKNADDMEVWVTYQKRTVA